MSKTFEQAAIEAALTKLFTRSSFSVCDLDTIGEMIGVNPAAHPNYKFLRGLHCVSYADMPKEIIDQIQQKVSECLRPTFTPSLIAKALLIEGNDHVCTEDYKRLN